MSTSDSIDITIREGGQGILSKTIEPGVYVVGSARDCDIVVDLPHVSAHHAQLTYVAGEPLIVEDLGAPGGTMIEGLSIEGPTEIGSGEYVALATALLTVCSPGGDDPSRPSVITPVELPEQDYSKVGTVGAGQMGDVLRAKDMSLERDVAMKTLSSRADALHKDDLGRLVNEGRITGQLEHPSIVPIHDLGVDDRGEVYFTMKFVQGMTLEELIWKIEDGDRAMLAEYPMQRLLVIFTKICDAVAFAHANGVVHRDLKPGNIMVGAFGEVLVMDWGLAKKVGDEEATRSVDTSASDSSTMQKIGMLATMDGDIKGTPQFMSPEQADGRIEDTDERSDVFSLGGILYSMLTLRPPHTGANVHEVLLKARKGLIPTPFSLNAPDKIFAHCPDGKIPAALSAVAMKALATKPEDRYQAVKDLQADIEAYQGGFATSAEGAGLWKQLTLFMRRNRGVSIAAGSAAILLIAVLGFSAWGSYTERLKAESALQQFEHEQEQRQTDRTHSAPVFLETARQAMRVGDFKKAKISLEVAREFDPSLSAPWMLNAQLAITEGDYQSAVNALREYVQQAPSDPDGTELLRLSREANRKETKEVVSELFNFFHERKALAIAASLAHSTENQMWAYRRQIYAAWPAGGAKLTMDEDGEVHFELTHDAEAGRSIDLSPLRGIPITKLDLAGHRIDDLSPLEGMPLKELYLERSSVRDITPLQGLPLEVLDITATGVEDISPLKGVPLRELYLTSTGVEDLSPLVDAPMELLNIDVTPVSELPVFRRQTLKELLAQDTQISDLTPLADQPLKGLHIERTPVESLDAVASLPIRAISVNGCRQLSDVKALQGKWLEGLSLSDTVVDDITPLRGMPLRVLELRNTKVSDLRPLADAPLVALDLSGCTNVTDITPLRGLPLSILGLSYSGVTNLAPLRYNLLRILAVNGCPSLESIEPLRDNASLSMVLLPYHVADIAFLRENPNMDHISYTFPPQPADEFWADYDRTSANPGARMRELQRLAVADAVGRQMVPQSALGFVRDYMIKSYRQQIDAAWPGQGKQLEFGDAFGGRFKLTHVFHHNEPVDLTPLQGIPLMDLDISGYDNIISLDPLEGMPLKSLIAISNSVHDLAPLKDMPMLLLDLRATDVEDLSPLEGMGLKWLSVLDTRVQDLSPLRDLPLVFLNIRCSMVEDLSALEGIPLKHLEAVFISVDDISPLKGMPLTFLDLGMTGAIDLNQLKGMPLKRLWLSGLTDISDVSALADLPLEELGLFGTGITDLDALSKMPLKNLNIENCRSLTDIHALTNLTQLEQVFIPYQVTDIDFLRDMTNIAGINYQYPPYPPAEFWKAHDTGWRTKPEKIAE